MVSTGFNKDNSIIVWRILFSYIIITYHFLNSYGVDSSLYVATDFFFIVSGFLIAKDASEEKYVTSFEMIKHKIKAFYPHYILSLLLGYIAFTLTHNGPQVSKAELLIEVGFIQMFGLNISHMVNVPTWYLSVLLMAGYIIYFLYQNYKKLYIGLVCPVSIIIIFTWFFRNYGFINHSSLGKEITTGIYWNRPFLLGFSMMCLGVEAFEINNDVGKRFRGGENHYIKMRVIEIMMLASVPILAIFFRKTFLDYVMVVMIFIGVALAFGNGGAVLAQNKGIKYFSRLSYPLFLNHNMFRELFPSYAQFSIHTYLVYLVLVTVYSMFTMLIIDKLKKGQKNEQNNYSSSTGKGK